MLHNWIHDHTSHRWFKMFIFYNNLSGTFGHYSVSISFHFLSYFLLFPLDTPVKCFLKLSVWIVKQGKFYVKVIAHLLIVSIFQLNFPFPGYIFVWRSKNASINYSLFVYNFRYNTGCSIYIVLLFDSSTNIRGLQQLNRHNN